MRRLKFQCLLIFSVLLLGLPAFAQQVTGNIEGIVTDQQQAVIPNASVHLTKEATNTTQHIKTDASGRYQFSTLPPGEYSVEVSATGFKTTKMTVNVRVTETASVDRKSTRLN